MLSSVIQICLSYNVWLPKYITKDPNALDKKRATRLVGVMSLDALQFKTLKSILNAFGDYFHSVYTNSTIPHISACSTKYLPHSINITNSVEPDIITVLKQAKNNSTSVYDGVPCFFLRDCAHVFSKPLHLFNFILECSTFPKQWKLSCVTPVLKKGSQLQADMYPFIVLQRI